MLISLLLVQGLSFHPLRASLLSATFLLCQTPTELGLEPSVSHICHFTQRSTVHQKSTYNSTQLPFFLYYQVSSDHFPGIRHPPTKKPIALHLLPSLLILSSSTPGSGKMFGSKNTCNIPPVIASAESIVSTVHGSSLQGSNAPW